MVRRKNRERVEYHGWYKYKNMNPQDLVLQFPLKSGRNIVPPGGIFEGDSRYQNTESIKLLANLMPEIQAAAAEKEKVKAAAVAAVEAAAAEKQSQETELLVETPPAKSTLEFFESNGDPIDDKNEKRKLDLSKKELLEFAELKNIKVNHNWSKEKILETIRH